MSLHDLGKMLLFLGGVTALLGLILLMVGRIPLVGRLPGDLTFRRGNVSCYIPIASSILLSLLLTLLFNLLFRLFNR